MDWLTFTTEIVKAAAWPIASLIALTMLRKPIAGLIPLMQRVKYKDLELEFGKQIEEIRVEAENELPQAEVRMLPRAPNDPLFELARVSPRSAVTEAWRDVEVATSEAATQLSAPDIGGSMRAPSTTRLIRDLARRGLIEEGVVGLYHDLRGLRNQAVHSPDFTLTTAAALEYASVARQVADYLRTVRVKDSSGS